MIHKTAIISATAKVGKQVCIGPYCVIGDEVTIGDRSIIESHVVIKGPTIIGQDNHIYSFSSLLSSMIFSLNAEGRRSGNSLITIGSNMAPPGSKKMAKDGIDFRMS